MASPGFRVYIDESGDEGFEFRPNEVGSSRWFVLSAVLTHREDDRVVVEVMREVRKLLKRPPNAPLHFVKLPHEQRVPWMRAIGQAPLTTISVIVYKPALRQHGYSFRKHELYWRTCCLLFERVVDFCLNRWHVEKSPEPKKAEVIFSNRGQMSYKEIQETIRSLQNPANPDGGEQWTLIPADWIRAVEHSKMAGLQIADAVASGLMKALRPMYGETEEKYTRLIAPTFYRKAKCDTISPPSWSLDDGRMPEGLFFVTDDLSGCDWDFLLSEHPYLKFFREFQHAHTQSSA